VFSNQTKLVNRDSSYNDIECSINSVSRLNIVITPLVPARAKYLFESDKPNASTDPYFNKSLSLISSSICMFWILILKKVP